MNMHLTHLESLSLFPLAHEQMKYNQKHTNDLWNVCIHTKLFLV
jgi:hypothetical protein